MLRTRVGYAGGTTHAPTYQSIGDHSEAIEIDFDPAVVSYEELLDVFVNSHNPCRTAYSAQYRSAIFYANEAQRSAAQRALKRVADERNDTVETGLEPHTGFTLAEDYHQKYILRSQRELLAEFLELYPDREGFLASTAVTRANAFLRGHGSEERVRADLPRMGLSERSQRQLAGRAGL